jgi:hypothetical protein
MNFSKKTLIVSLMITFLLTLVVGAGPVLAVHDNGFFELDADAHDDVAKTGHDWDTINSGGGGGSIARTGVLVDPAPNSIFAQGGSKDINDISDWHHKDGSVPDKDDITDAYAVAFDVNGDLVIYFGADRLANNGDAFIGFWFFQDEVEVLPDGTFNGTHQVNDILVLANFEQGGGVPSIQVLSWVGTGGDQKQGTLELLFSDTAAECGSGSLDLVCAITNTVPTPSPWPYTPKGGSPGDLFPEVTFFEGGINISELFLGVFGNDNLPCFASFMAETRSSTSVTSQLKDFMLGSFPVCDIEITNQCTDGVVNPGQTGFVYEFNGTVTNTGFGTLYNVNVIIEITGGDDLIIPLGDLTARDYRDFSNTFETTLNPPTISASVEAVTNPDPGAPPNVFDGPIYDTCPDVNHNPLIDVTKACEAFLEEVENCGLVVKVEYSGQVCNPTGPDHEDPNFQDPINLTNVIVTDDAGTPADTSDDSVFNIGDLAAGDCEPYGPNIYTPSELQSSAQFTNTVTATGTAVLGFGDVSASKSATCPLCP